MTDSPPTTTDDYHISIVSYGHSNGPLVVPAEHQKLTFNVRDIPNPAAGLRRTHTGLSDNLRRDILASHEAQECLSEMIKAVNVRMDEMEEMEIVRPPTPPEPERKLTKKERLKLAIGEVEEEVDTAGKSGTLVVGIVCEEGRHRSVVFAEELREALRRGDEWRITVDHRDLSGLKDGDGPESPGGEVTSPTTAKPQKTKKQKNQESRRRKTSQRGFLNDEE